MHIVFNCFLWKCDQVQLNKFAQVEKRGEGHRASSHLKKHQACVRSLLIHCIINGRRRQANRIDQTVH